MRINGTMTQAAFKVVSTPVIVPSRCRTIAQCAAKQTSATVANSPHPGAASSARESSQRLAVAPQLGMRGPPAGGQRGLAPLLHTDTDSFPRRKFYIRRVVIAFRRADP